MQFRNSQRHAFTLIELLVVIAIIAILSVVVILTLNPAELLRQSRDSNRLSDLQTMNSALGIYAAQGGTSFGSSSIVYVSIPDPTATSTAGDQCQGLGLPTAPSGTSYFCEASSSYRNVNGTGWIPINFSTLSAGSPLGELPQDPINTTTTGNYYTYATNGSQFIVTALPESSKTKSNLATNPQIPDYPEVMAQGSNLTISPLWSPTGLVGYWNFEEGSGTTALDTSGNGNNGSWSGTQAGSSGYYSGGKVGSWAGYFNGTNNYANLGIPQALNIIGNITLSAWVNISTLSKYNMVITKSGSGSTLGYELEIGSTNNVRFLVGSVSSQLLGGTVLSSGAWYFIVAVYNGATENVYVNGVNDGGLSWSTNPPNSSSTNAYIGQRSDLNASYAMAGSIDDVRIYNRALSPAEVQALYNAEK